MTQAKDKPATGSGSGGSSTSSKPATKAGGSLSLARLRKAADEANVSQGFRDDLRSLLAYVDGEQDENGEAE